MNNTVIITKAPIRSGKHSTPDGALCGNGDIGIVLGNSGNGLRIYVAKNDMWLFCERGDLPGGIKPIGYIDINIPQQLYQNYYVEQRMHCGELFCSFKSGDSFFYVTVAVSAVSSFILLSLEASDTSLLAQEPQYIPFEKYSRIDYIRESDFFGFKKELVGENVVISTKCCTLIKKISAEKLKKRYAVCAVTNHDDALFEERAKQCIADFNADSFDKTSVLHKKWWSDFWSKSSMVLSDKKLELNWNASQYLLAICARNPYFPPGIYGNFITIDDVNWKGDYHLNYNYQAPFYHLCSSNHIELTDCYSAPIENFYDKGRKFAAEYLGVRGVYYPTGIGPKGTATELCGGVYSGERPFLGQKSNAAHAADIMIFRWYSQRDIEYAKNHLYPFLRAVGDFWEDYLVKENDKYVIVNDAIHEIPYYKDDFKASNYKKEIHEKNNLLSLGLVRMVFKCLLDVSQELQLDECKRKTWLDILENLSEYPTYRKNFKKVFRYTQNGTKWNDTNFLCLQHCYPASQIGMSSDSKTLKTAINTFNATSRWFDGNATNSVFPCAARLGINPDKIIKKLKENYKRFELSNLLLLHGGGCIENCSLTAATLNEMALQSFEGVVRIFPNWDKNIDCEFKDLRADGAFLVSAKIKSGEIDYVKIKSEKGRDLKIQNPFEKCLVEGQTFSKEFDSRYISLKTNAGEEIFLKSTNITG